MLPYITLQLISGEWKDKEEVEGRDQERWREEEREGRGREREQKWNIHTNVHTFGDPTSGESDFQESSLVCSGTEDTIFLWWKKSGMREDQAD